MSEAVMSDAYTYTGKMPAKAKRGKHFGINSKDTEKQVASLREENIKLSKQLIDMQGMMSEMLEKIGDLESAPRIEVPEFEVQDEPKGKKGK